MWNFERLSKGNFKVQKLSSLLEELQPLFRGASAVVGVDLNPPTLMEFLGTENWELRIRERNADHNLNYPLMNQTCYLVDADEFVEEGGTNNNGGSSISADIINYGLNL